MPFSVTIKTLLDQSVDLTNIVGTKKSPLIMRQEEVKPYVVWKQSMTPVDTKDPESSPIDDYTVQFFFAAENYNQAHEMSEILRDHIDCEFGNQVVGGKRIQLIRFLNMNEEFVPGPDEFMVTDTYQIKINR